MSRGLWEGAGLRTDFMELSCVAGTRMVMGDAATLVSTMYPGSTLRLTWSLNDIIHFFLVLLVFRRRPLLALAFTVAFGLPFTLVPTSCPIALDTARRDRRRVASGTVRRGSPQTLQAQRYNVRPLEIGRAHV